MVCTLSIREGPEECLCQGNGCMLSPASPPWETGSEMSDSSICSQSQVQPHCCNRGSRLLPVGGNTFDPEAGFTRPPTPQWIPALLPIHGRNLHGFRSAYVMLPLAGHCWLLCPTRHQGWALGHTQPASHGARATRATGAGLCQLQGQAGIARDALEAGGRVSTIALQNTLLSRSQSQHQCP